MDSFKELLVTQNEKIVQILEILLVSCSDFIYPVFSLLKVRIFFQNTNF